MIKVSMPAWIIHLRRVSLLLIAIITAIAGCSEEQRFPETRRVVDRVTEAEVRAFLAVAASFPEAQSVMPGLQPSPPEWNTHRTLPVQEMAAEERKLLADRVTHDQILRRLPESREFLRALRRERMSASQFAGLWLTLAAAINRSTVKEDSLIDSILQRSQPPLAELDRDTRVFASLAPETSHDIQRQAAWIALADRAAWLKLVPPSNVERVAAFQEELNKIFPKELSTYPFLPFADLLEDEGTPFEELPESGRDTDLKIEI